MAVLGVWWWRDFFGEKAEVVSSRRWEEALQEVQAG